MEIKEKLSIGEAADLLGVSVDTLRRWDASGKLKAQKSKGKHRYYFLTNLKHFSEDLDIKGKEWAASKQAFDLSDTYYCERQDRFTSRLEKMAVLMLESGNIDEETVSLITTVAGEIGDNAFMHNIGNWPDAPGVFYAYDFGKRIIVLADRGQGVRKTLLRVRPNIQSDTEALRVAFTEVVSGREPEKRGNGLKVVRRIIENYPIGLFFQSGMARVTCSKLPEPIKIKQASENIRGVYAVITF